jgi:hypothetical protein
MLRIYEIHHDPVQNALRMSGAFRVLVPAAGAA